MPKSALDESPKFPSNDFLETTQLNGAIAPNLPGIYLNLLQGSGLFWVSCLKARILVRTINDRNLIYLYVSWQPMRGSHFQG